MKVEKEIGVLLCRCRGRLSQRLDLGTLKKDLSGIESVAFVDIVDDMCNDPVPLKNIRSKGLVFAGCGTRRHIRLFEETLESAKIPFFLCEFVDLLSALGADRIASCEAAEFARLILRAHIKKVHAAFETALPAKAAGIKEVLGVRKEKVTRRSFLRLPLMAAKRVSHYEEHPLFDEKRCIASESPCRECIRHCPFGALEIRKGKIQILKDRCEKCGFCVTVCPVDAVQMPAFSALQVLRLVEALADRRFEVEHRSLVFTCDQGREKMSENTETFHRGPLNPITVRVPCVAALTPTLLLRSLELGFEAVIPLCPDKACPKAEAREAWRKQVDSLLRVIEDLGMASRLAFLTLDPEAGTDLPQLLQDLLSRQGPSHSDLQPGPMSLHSREDLVRILGTLGQKEAVSYPEMEGLSLPFFDIRIDQEKCCFCGACSRHCPAGALKTQDGPEPLLQYAALSCVGCKNCVEICPEGAVSIQRTMDLSRLRKGVFVAKARDESARCRNCGAIIGKRSLLESVEKKLKGAGFEELAERMYYCKTCKNRAVHRGEDL